MNDSNNNNLMDNNLIDNSPTEAFPELNDPNSSAKQNINNQTNTTNESISNNITSLSSLYNTRASSSNKEPLNNSKEEIETLSQKVTPPIIEPNNFNNKEDIPLMTEPVIDPNYSHNIESTSPTPSNNLQQEDEELLKAFIGPNYEKITTSNFNFAGFFFNTFYMLYRKMFLYALLIFIINILIGSKLNSILTTSGFSLIIGLFINKLYLYYATRKINKIKSVNPEKNLEELKEICKRKGGTSVGTIFLGLIIEIIIIIAYIVLALGVSILSIGTDILLLPISNIISKETNSTFDGTIIYDTSINIPNDFIITVPSIFENESNNSSYSYKYTSDQGIFNECSFNFLAPVGFTSGEKLIEQMKNYYKEGSSEITKTSINNISWSTFSYNSGLGTTYYYATTKNNKAYLLEYQVGEDADISCVNYKEPIIASITLK